jgi:hypothetical protein
MTFSYRMGAIVTLTREDGNPGPGEMREYKASDGWEVVIRDEGCVEITGYRRRPMPPPIVVPWHRIWEIKAILVPLSGQRGVDPMTSTLAVGTMQVDTKPLGSLRTCAERSCEMSGQQTDKLRCPACGKFTKLT